MCCRLTQGHETGMKDVSCPQHAPAAPTTQRRQPRMKSDRTSVVPIVRRFLQNTSIVVQQQPQSPNAVTGGSSARRINAALRRKQASSTALALCVPCSKSAAALAVAEVALGTRVAPRRPHRSQQALLARWAPPVPTIDGGGGARWDLLDWVRPHLNEPPSGRKALKADVRDAGQRVGPMREIRLGRASCRPNIG
jgi:hypothetical protein